MASTQILLENLLLRSATKECHYLILLLPEEPQTNLLRESEDKVLQEISHFEIQGQHCAIIEAENTSLTNKPSLADLLTKRELQIVMLVALGKANKQIARQLHISEWTVASYIRRIFNKLGVDSRAAMVYYCASLIQRYCQRGATQKSCIDLTQSRQGIDEERELEPDVSFHS